MFSVFFDKNLSTTLLLTVEGSDYPFQGNLRQV